jgi:hypothetical protein
LSVSSSHDAEGGSGQHRIETGSFSYARDDSAPHKAYIYNTCVTLAVSVDPYLIPVSSEYFVLFVSNPNRCQNAKLPPIYWRLNSPLELDKVTEQLQLVRPPLECDQSIRPEDCDETVDIKKSKRRILQTVLAEICPLTPTDAESQDVVWSGLTGSSTEA